MKIKKGICEGLTIEALNKNAFNEIERYFLGKIISLIGKKAYKKFPPGPILLIPDPFASDFYSDINLKNYERERSKPGEMFKIDLEDVQVMFDLLNVLYRHQNHLTKKLKELDIDLNDVTQAAKNAKKILEIITPARALDLEYSETQIQHLLDMTIEDVLQRALSLITKKLD